MTELFSYKDDVQDPYDAWKCRRHKFFVKVPELLRKNPKKVPYNTSRILPPDLFFHGEKIYFELRNLFYGNEVYVLTDRRIIKRHGLLNHRYSECALENIKMIKPKFNFWPKNCGDLEFTVKDGNVDKIKWTGIRNLERIFNLILVVLKQRENNGQIV